MAADDSEDKIYRLQAEVEAANARAKDFENKMMQAAMYGKDLLDKNLELESQIEETRQGQHEQGLRLQAKVDLERSLAVELEALRETLKVEEQKLEQWKEEEGDRANKRDAELKQRISELEQEQELTQSREARLKDLVETLEKQVGESNSALNRSVAGESFTAEYETVQQENISLLQEKQTLEVELARTREELESLRANMRTKDSKLEAQAADVETLQCEMSGYISSIEGQKMEIMEIQAQLDAERNQNVNEDGKGNSLFSEVEDRRQRVESQLSTLTKKYDIMKEGYDGKVSELQKVKMHNSQLLSIAGTRNDTEHVNRLEEMLNQEKEKVRVLMEKLDTIDSLKTNHNPLASSVGANQQDSDVSLMETDTSDVAAGQHTLESSEYKYLAHLLTEADNKNKKAQEELRKQVRQNMEESDKQRELCRKLHNHEQQINKLKADNYTLKIQIEEDKANNLVNKSSKKEVKKKKIVEYITFGSEEKENTADNKEKFIVKEVVKHTGSKAPLESEVEKGTAFKEEVEGGKEEGEPVKKRRGIVLCDKVEEIGVDGESVQKDLVDEAKEKKAVEKKPKGGRKHFGDKKVVVAEAEQCNQQ